MIADENEQNGSSAQRLISLCKEFTAYLVEAKAEFEKLYERSIEVRAGTDSKRVAEELQALSLRSNFLRQKVFVMQSAISDLARATSQQVEHSDLGFADKFELRLRLAQLAAQMTETQSIVAHLSPSFG